MRDFLRRLAAILLVLSVLGLLVLTSDKPIPPPFGPPEDAPHAIVSLGDSTMSGEGTGDYLPGTDGEHDNWCHRSPEAMINNVTVPATSKVFNFACSGTGTDRIALNAPPGAEPSQARQLADIARAYRVTTIAIAVGANDDPQFGPLLTSCVQAIFDSGKPGCGQQISQQWPARIATMIPKIVKAVGDVRRVMTDNGYPNASYALVLQSYAAPVAPNVAKNLQNLNGCPFRTDDLRWVQDKGVPQLNDGIRKAAALAGTRFLDLSKAGTGHEACSGGSNTDTEWFTRLTVNWADFQNDARTAHAAQASFHPNAKGYVAFGDCMTRFLATTDTTAACVPDGHGGLKLLRTGH